MSMPNEQDTMQQQKMKRVKLQRSYLSANSEWTYEEKYQLLQGLRKYGHLDMKNLCRTVPSKSKNEIKLLINILWKNAHSSEIQQSVLMKRKRKGIDDNFNKLPPIDQWIHLFQEAQPKTGYRETKNLPIAKTFMYISKFGKLPDPVSCNGVDFKAMYDMLYCLLSGYPVKSLNAPTANFVLHSLKEFEQDYQRLDMTKETEFLKEVKHINYSDDSEFDSTKVPYKNAEECFKILLGAEGYNPLGVPFELLKSKTN